MRSLVVFESMYGNTHVIADRIADGLRLFGAVTVVSVAEATSDAVAAADLLVVGGPTHVHGLSSPRTRQAAMDAAPNASHPLAVDTTAPGTGLREWMESLPGGRGGPAAAFDTRMPGPPVFTGRASKRIARRLAASNYRLAVEPMSFMVDEDNTLAAGSEIAARVWAEALGSHVSSSHSADQNGDRSR